MRTSLKATLAAGAIAVAAIGVAVLEETPPPCACSMGSNCERYQTPVPRFDFKGGWGAAPTGLTLQPDKWRGGGCLQKACTQMAGANDWPKGCPQ